MSFTLLFDIGNTNIKAALADKKGIVQSFSLPTSREHTADSLGLDLTALLRFSKVDATMINGAVASSVVPGVNGLLLKACQRYIGHDIRFVPDDLPIPLENRYEEPLQVGADRLVGAFAARRLHPDAPSIICIDYGTATTFDCIEGNAYLGGLICPGVLSAASALAAKTAKLPAVALEVDSDLPLPGRSTSTSISHGFVFGFASMSEGLCARLAKSLKGPVTVVATGGFAQALAAVTDCFDDVRPDLLMEGLRLVSEGNGS